jgi:hypothetical protein
MRGEQPMRPSRNVFIVPWANNEVSVIRHEARADDWQLDVVACLGHEPEKFGEVPAIVKSVRAIVAAIDHVVAVIGSNRARGSRHARKRMNTTAENRFEKLFDSSR